MKLFYFDSIFLQAIKEEKKKIGEQEKGFGPSPFSLQAFLGFGFCFLNALLLLVEKCTKCVF